MKVFVVKIFFLQLATAKSAAKLGIFFDMTKEKAGKIISGLLLFYVRTLLQRPADVLVLAVVDVVALCGSHLLFEVGDAGLDEDVVPLDELLDM